MRDLRTRVQLAVHAGRGAWRQGRQGQHVADGVQVGADLLGEDVALDVLRRNESRHEEVLRNRKPAAIRRGRVQALHGVVVALLLVFHGGFFDFLERQLLVLVLWRVQGRAREAAVEERIADRLVAVMRQLQIQLRRDGRCAHVGDVVAHVDDVVAALEGKRLGQLDAAFDRFHHQLNLLAIGQGTYARLHGETARMGREWTADQARLRQVSVVRAFVEQHFVLLAFVRLAPFEQAEAAAEPARIARALELQQFQTLDLAAQGVDVDLDDVGGDGNHFALERGGIDSLTRQGRHACRSRGSQGIRLGRGRRRLGGLFRVRGEHRRLAVRDHPFVPENYQRDGKHDPQDGTFIDIH